MMRKTIFYMSIVFALTTVAGGLTSAATAGITWDGEFDEFRFAVQDNGGFFRYDAAPYYISISYDTEEYSYRPTQNEFDNYSRIAEGDLFEFTTRPGDIRLRAMAKGTGEATSPPNGLKVQGYLETIPSSLTLYHALDTEQTVIVWVSRKFSVDEEGIYDLNATLSGAVIFDDYYYHANDSATYSVSGEVAIEEIIDDTVFKMMSGFPQSLDDVDPMLRKGVRLKTQTDSGQTVTYRLKIALRLESNIVNFSPSSNKVHRAVNGTYQLGTQSAPFILEAELSPSNSGGVSPWMNLLLSD